jgi:very-short-patch-repair endonuclease
VWFDEFNPDFICNPKKKIIELYGDYWHSLPRYKKLDKKRIEVYSKYGFQTLVIWEHELKNIIQVVNKIRNFLDN